MKIHNQSKTEHNLPDFCEDTGRPSTYWTKELVMMLFGVYRSYTESVIIAYTGLFIQKRRGLSKPDHPIEYMLGIQVLLLLVSSFFNNISARNLSTTKDRKY